MGSSCELKFDDISLLSQKSGVPDDFVCLFQESDRRESVGDDPDDDTGSVGYFAERSVVLARLDLLGYSSENARSHFDEWLARERATWSEFEKDGGGSWASETAGALRSFSYEQWLSRARDVLLTRYDFTRPIDEFKDEIDRQMRDLSEGWLFYGNSFLPALRSMLDAFPEVREVSLDIGDLINGGYVDPTEKICETRRAPHLQWRSDLQPTVIVAEGSTDVTVLKRSLQRLYPHLTDYFTFFDHDGPSVDGGAGYLVKFLRAFAAARINTNILAIFDNDAAGLEAFNVASKVPLPANITVTKLPNIEIARSYPTIGPQGEHSIDVNGTAASIELFLGRHNLLADGGSLIPVVWSNYVQAARAYQGAIAEKRKVFERFLDETNANNSSEHYRSRFPELVTLWEHIFSLLKASQQTVKADTRN